jgi:hypothetical protein
MASFSINSENLSFQRLLNYSAFIGLFADHAAPSCALNPVVVLNALGSPSYDLSITYAYCNITIDALYGANHVLL